MYIYIISTIINNNTNLYNKAVWYRTDHSANTLIAWIRSNGIGETHTSILQGFQRWYRCLTFGIHRSELMEDRRIFALYTEKLICNITNMMRTSIVYDNI